VRFRARLSTISRKWTAVHLAQREGDSAVEARIAGYELAYRMQSHAPEAVDLTHETERVVDQDLAPQKPWFPTTSPLATCLITIDHSRENSANYQNIHWSTDCQLDRLADTTEHFHERIDGELGGFLIHHVGHTRARDHQNLGGIGLL
jgi:hypothetical protein